MRQEVFPVKVIMRIPLDLSRSLLAGSDRAEGEYESMANGLIREEHLIVHCEEQKAAQLLSWADVCVPGARKRIRILRDL